MDLASGYSDSINYGNGYTPLATNAINNNNADYYRNQAAMALLAQQAQNNVFASGGGFGQQTADYAGAGAAYGRATGGFGGTTSQQSVFESGADPYQDWLKSGGYNAPSNWNSGGGIGSDAVGAPNQPGVAVNWDKYFSDATGNQQPASGASPTAGYDYNNPGSYGGLPAGGFQQMNNPDMQRLLGYTPNTPYSGGGIGSDAARASSQPGNVPNPYASQPWWNTFAAAAGPQGVAEWLQSQGVGGIGGNVNTYGYPASGAIGGQDAFGGQPQQTPSGQGGIGSDRDPYGWTLAQSSPYATAGAPANGPYPNLGYNPAMQNSFANPVMQQYDWTKNNAALQQQMQDALKTIDGAGQQPAPPYGGELPPFWQGARDFFGMGAPQPAPDNWTNRS